MLVIRHQWNMIYVYHNSDNLYNTTLYKIANLLYKNYQDLCFI